MEQLLIHSLIISPVVRWVAAPQRRWSRKFGIRLAGIILLVLAVLQLRRVDLNCFDLLEVDIRASNSELSRAYRKQSALFHPDRSEEHGPAALPYGFETKGAVFLELQKCQEILSDKTKREVYNRFGQTDLELNKKDSSLMSILAVFSCIGYLINFVVCSVFTASTESQEGRYWVYSYLLFAMTSELFLKFLGQGDMFNFLPYFSSRLVYEQVEILKDVIPSVLSSAILLTQITHVDDSEMVNNVIRTVSNSNRDIANHIVSKRTGSDPPEIVPAVLRLVEPPPPPPNTLNEDDKKTTDGEASRGQAEAAAAPSRMQKIFDWIFYAYIIKTLIDAIRSMF